MCFIMLFPPQAWTCRATRIFNRTTDNVQRERSSLLPRRTACYAPIQGELHPCARHKSGRTEIPSVLPTPAHPQPAQRTPPAGRAAFPSAVPPSTSLQWNCPTPWDQSRPVPVQAAGPQAEEPHDCSCIAGHWTCGTAWEEPRWTSSL